MKSHHSCSTKTLFLGLFLVLGGSPATAAVLPVTDFEATDFTFTSLTIDGVEQTLLTGSTAALSSAASYYYPAASSSPLTGPGQADGAVSGLNYGNGAGNIAFGSIFQFGRVISNQDYIVVTDLANTADSPDNVGFRLVDASNAVVGTYSIDITSGQFGSALIPATSYTVRNNSNGNGIVTQNFVQFAVGFQLSDFTGAGDLSTVTGIEFFAGDNNAWDPSVVALATVPEPATGALLLLGAGLVLWRRRRV
ncbi:MAG: PEP-CTERM sorting domain-containing protein [Verrucomicrobiota bacterium]